MPKSKHRRGRKNRARRRFPVPAFSRDPLGLLSDGELNWESEPATSPAPRTTTAVPASPRWPPPLITTEHRPDPDNDAYDPAAPGFNRLDPRHLPARPVRIEAIRINGVDVFCRTRGDPLRAWPAPIPLERGSPAPLLLVSIARDRLQGLSLPAVPRDRIEWVGRLPPPPPPH